MPAPRPVTKPTPAKAKARSSEKQASENYKEIPTGNHKADPVGFTKHPHAYGHLLKGGKLGSQLQRDLIYWIEFYTYGQEDRPEWAKKSLADFGKLCQSWDQEKGKLTPADRKNVRIALADLETRQIIESRDRKGCGPTTAKMYRVTPENWYKAPPYVPPTPKQIADAEAEAAEETAADSPAADSPEVISDAPAPEEPETRPETTTVSSGRISRPQPVNIRPTKDAEPIVIRLVYNPTGFDFPVSFRARPGQNGRIHVSAHPHQTGEIKANDCGSGHPQLKKSFVENKRFNDIDVCANAISVETWGIPLSDARVKLIAAAMPTAPVELFDRIARRKLSARNAASKHVPGLLIHLAEEAETGHAKWLALQQRQKAAQPAPAPPVTFTPEELAVLAEHEAQIAQLCERCRGRQTDPTGFRKEGNKRLPVPCTECDGTGRKAGA
jgi:hypothetical protein